MNIDLKNTLALAVEWAKEVGEVQRSYFRSGHLELETKSTVHDVVTKVDKLSESMLIERIGKCFPNHSVLGEESGEHDAHSDYLWVVDPLDGTNNYSQGLPVFCVSIGLQYRGETLLGVVYAPYLNELYTAIRGKGAFLNNVPIHGSGHIKNLLRDTPQSGSCTAHLLPGHIRLVLPGHESPSVSALLF